MRDAIAAVAAAVGGRLGAVVAVGLLGALAGTAWGLADRPTYEASASVVAADRGPIEAPAAAFDPDSAQFGARLAQLAEGRRVGAQAAADLGGDLSGAALLSRIDARPREAGVTITARSENPELAAASADAHAAALVAVARRSDSRRLERAVERLRAELEELDPASVEATALADRVAALSELDALGDPLEVAGSAELPREPVENRSALAFAALGLLVGLLLGALVAAVRSRGPAALGAGEELERATGVPLLAEIDGLGETVAVDTGGALRLRGDGAAALASLAHALGIDRPGAGPPTLALTATAPAEERPALALGLAAAAATAGTRVIVVEANLRNPTIAGLLGLPERPGLAEYLAGEAAPRQVMRSINLDAAASAAAPPSLVCVPAGSAEGTRSTLAGSELAGLARRLRRVYDLVIFELPALLERGEGQALAGAVEATILYAGAGRRRPAVLRRALRRLGWTEPLGCVLLRGSGVSDRG